MNVVDDQFVAQATDDSFVNSLSNVLLHIVKSNETKKGVVTRFHSMNAPPISIPDYVNRIARHVRCSNECFVLALVYIERITKMHKNFVVSILNVHRLIITAVMLAAKFSDDVYFSNKFYAQVGGVNVAEINMLESQFLTMLNFQLYVNTLEYESCRMNVEKASYAAALSNNPWALAWYYAAANCSDGLPKEPADMPMMPYANTQPPLLACSTRYFEDTDMNEQNGIAHAVPFKSIPCAPQYDKGLNPNLPYCPPTQDSTFDGYAVGTIPGYSRTMDHFSRQATSVTPGYHVLSNVHMPQMAPTPRIDTPGAGTPSSRFMRLNPEMCGPYGNINPGGTFFPVPMFPSASVEGKPFGDVEHAIRRPTSTMLNRMYTHHVDYLGQQQTWWNRPKRAAPTDCKPAFNAMNVVDMNNGFGPFMNAFEMRRIDSINGKCAPSTEDWNCKDNRQLCRSRNKIKEAA
ncbi:cyclin2 related [Babesia ovis]|uniref:Cyclin2 related n=1 Tax=Babesia ovis TaxID=5869 RepID=A0A9W5WV50_BABOV|nr:cyclin2 related [Babesia ovis]